MVLAAGAAAEAVGIGRRRPAPIRKQAHGELRRKPRSHDWLRAQDAVTSSTAARWPVLSRSKRYGRLTRRRYRRQ